MSVSLHCDRDGCDSWQREPAEAFLTLSGQYGPDKHFCNLECCLVWTAAQSIPITTVEW